MIVLKREIKAPVLPLKIRVRLSTDGFHWEVR
jgi:hypothetical protein